MHITNSPWLPCMSAAVTASMRVFCFGHAGSNAMIYARWQGFVPSDIHICPVVLPGRGERLREEPCDDLMQLVSEATTAILPHTDSPFAVFGHSMGAILGFEVLRLLRREHGYRAAHLFVAGSPAPQFKRGCQASVTSDADALAMIKSFKGTPSSLLENDEAMKLLLPALRADLCALDSYMYTAGTQIDCPITAFAGLEDKYVNPVSLTGWREHATQFGAFVLPGDHFSMLNEPRRILAKISSELTSSLVAIIPTA
jgi:medium-chain acyl-[acyl-carrier-protein] hydrolase